MSLLSLKTRDLTWQDATLNIEVMLAPGRSTLLWNKHKSLSSHCSKDKKKFERQFENVVKNFKSEKILIDRQRVDLYTKRTLVFLEKLPPETRSDLLNRKSFSISLNRIANDLNSTNQGNPVQETGRASAPATAGGTRTSKPDAERSSDQSQRRHSGLPMLSDRRKSSVAAIPKPSTAPEKRNSTVHLFALTSGLSPRQNNIFPFNKPNTPDRPDHLPVIGAGQGAQSNNLTPRSNASSQRSPREQAEEGEGDAKKNVRFRDNPKIDPEDPLQKKIKGFLTDQMQFNLNAPIAGRSDLARKVEARKFDDDKMDIVSEFNKFCKSDSKNKKKFHSLIRLASRIKLTSSKQTSDIPSIELTPAAMFSDNRTGISVS